MLLSGCENVAVHIKHLAWTCAFAIVSISKSQVVKSVGESGWPWKAMGFTLLVMSSWMKSLPSHSSRASPGLGCLVCCPAFIQCCSLHMFSFSDAPSGRCCWSCTVSSWHQGQWAFGEVAGGGMCPFCPFLFGKWVVGSWMAALGTSAQWSGIVRLCPDCSVESIQSSWARRSSRWYREALGSDRKADGKGSSLHTFNCMRRTF